MQMPTTIPDPPIRRRRLLQMGAGSAGALGGAFLGAAALPLLGQSLNGSGGQAGAQMEDNPLAVDHEGHSLSATVGDVDVERMGFDPSVLVRTFDYGEATRMADGTTVREWDISAYDKEIEIAPGVFFPAWTYNGQVPGPTLRANEGDRLLRLLGRRHLPAADRPDRLVGDHDVGEASVGHVLERLLNLIPESSLGLVGVALLLALADAEDR